MSSIEQLKLVMPLQRLLAQQGVEISPQSLIDILADAEKGTECPSCITAVRGLCFPCFIRAVGKKLGYEDGVLPRILERSIEDRERE